MRLPDRLIPRSITTQITSIVAVSVVLGLVLTVTMLLSFGVVNRDGASAVAERIANITRLVRSAASPAEVGVIIAAAQRSGIDVRYVALTDLEASPRNARLPLLSGLVVHQLEFSQNIEVIDDARYPAGPVHQLIVKMDDRAALIFEASAGTSVSSLMWRFLLAPTTLTLTTVLVFVLLLSIYAVRWIIAPLSAVAAAANSFGRSPDNNHAVNRRAPREIAQVADALNEMRIRIRSLLDDRTRMLAAISHDLRTPLTRLRLRAEKVADQSLRENMQHEIEQISHMLNETLDYLRHDARSEGMSRVDLPSILQTVCADFADVGQNVSYEGPGRLTWTCRPTALTRAISNVVANGVKHGSFVAVSLKTDGDATAQIDISDDGPGIPDALRTKVFEPFFKGDDARALAGDGFGLGLSIARDVVSGHRGEISLLQRLPVGLTVRIQLPRAGETGSARAPEPAVESLPRPVFHS
ncbi:ATP-binding protein [Bradyrhizobium cosmicum]|uniref:ATP-binding protein n=1 Tax=Bradyrhizobium cosmicum TaxID=1404864 RepID=UPI0028EA4048|nr:ATP-binding protein [Bradyrhizobium cosmicum]